MKDDVIVPLEVLKEPLEVMMNHLEVEGTSGGDDESSRGGEVTSGCGNLPWFRRILIIKEQLRASL